MLLTKGDSTVHRFHKTRYVPKKKTIWLIRAFIMFGAVFSAFLLFDHTMRPVIVRMAQYRCRVVSIEAINEAVLAEMEKIDVEKQNLISVEKTPDGSVAAVIVDSAAMNQLKAQLTAAVAERLAQVPKQKIGIPIGTLLGWQVLAGWGPDITMQVVPASYVQSTVVDSLESAGINQTQYRVSLRFTVEMSAILPGYPSAVTVENDVCVAKALIVGKVPQFYASAG